MYIARDENNELRVYLEEPRKTEHGFVSDGKISGLIRMSSRM